MRNPRKSQRWYWMATAVFIIGLLSLTLLFWVIQIGEHQRVNSALIDDIMNVEIQAATTHLWIEEAVGGDTSVDTGQILVDMDKAIRLLKVVLGGGELEHGFVTEPLRDPDLRARAEKLKTGFEQFRMLGEVRLKNPVGGGVGTPLDQQFDGLFKEVLASAKSLENAIEAIRERELMKSKRLFLWILVAWSSVITVASAGLWNRERRRRTTEEALLSTNEQLFSQAKELTEHREHLAELVGERTTQLAAANELLRDEINERKRYEKELEYQATHDGLTGLPNRNLLADRLQQAILIARRHQGQAAALFVDLDNFKYINDSMGHDFGDLMLKSVAERLITSVRSEDTVARHGGDEFVIVVSDLALADDASKIAGKILETVARSFTIRDRDLAVTCSMGISIYPRDGEDALTLLKNADAAMYRAKEQGRNNFQYFTEALNIKMVERMNTERALRCALEHDEFLLFYQPKVDLISGAIVGMEALIRWQHPELGMVSPASFIPIAEETGLIELIGEWVLRTACMRNKAWQDAGLPKLPVAINLSVRQFKTDALPGIIRQTLRETGLEPRYLEFEITESLLMRDTERMTDLLRELKDIGVHLDMDDFGTGYSCLGYLRRFPFDKLKLDISFVRDITNSPDCAAIALSVIDMAHNLRMKVIAEGVETEGQMNFLRSHGCDEMQGHYFSRPLPAAELEQLLREGQSLAIPNP